MLYTPKEVTTARRNADIYGWAKEEREAVLEACRPWMARPDEAIWRLVTGQSLPRGTRTNPDRGCPSCGWEIYSRFGTYPWKVSIDRPWTLDAPDEIRCRTCGTVYPNAAYPSDGAFEMADPTGKPQVYRYHRAANGKVCFLEGKLRELRYDFLRDQASALAQLYGLTGDAEAARRAALILYRFAEVYPHWPVSGIDTVVPGEGKGPEGAHNFFFDPNPPHPNRSGKWTWWHYMEIPSDLVMAYDQIYASGALEAVAPDVRARIENNMLRPSVAFVHAFWPGDTGNMSGNEIRGRIVSGRVLGEPAWVHQAVDHIRRVVESGYFADGMWREGTPSYHTQITNNLRRAAGLLRGYTDPPGYVDSLTGDRYDNLDPAAHFPLLETARNAHLAMAYPDGRIAPVHDTWARAQGRQGRTRTWESSQGSPGSRLLPATGHAVLSAGDGKEALQAHLHFCLTDGHAHKDLLNLSLFAKGRELLSDFGYTHTFRREWATCTLGHNTVLVDGDDQKVRRRETWGNLRLYETTDPAVQAASASSETAYPGLDVYRRTVAVVDAGGGNVYVLDLFHVAGGALHEWALHGAADADQALVLSVPVRPAAESLAALLSGRGEPGSGRYERYAEVYDVAVGKGEAPFSATFRYADGQGPRLRTTYLRPVPDEVVSGMAPSIHRASRDNAQVDKIRTPIFVARRAGQNLRSAFLAVHEAFQEAPFLDRVESLSFKDPLAAGARIVSGERTDRVLSAPEPEGRAEADGVALTGRLALVRVRGGEIERLDLIDGRGLRVADISLELQAPFAGEISGAGSGASPWLDTAVPLPEGDVLHGRTLLLTFLNGRTQSCSIARIEPLEGRSRIHLLDDPAIAVEAGRTRLLAFPHWSFDAPPRFEIAPIVTLSRKGPNRFLLRATCDLTLGLPSKEGASRLVFLDRQGQPAQIRGQRAEDGIFRVRLPVARLVSQGTELWVE